MLNKIFAAVVMVGASVSAAMADPNGLWLANDGAHIGIAACGNGLCGVLLTTASPVDPATGRSWTDKNNVDPRLQKRPLVGVRVIMGTRPNGPGTWSGQVYNADDGKIYTGNLKEIDAKTIRVEGCVSAMCGGENMTRIR
jgi:uncharacterized protein (DUF2147 family)